ncbi:MULTISPECIES: type I secretion system permease/ATPase [unclassified Rhizobium]|uniref:type I secretion system permease/ATPase n=1 Tax=unclassified Rhizobium TaxID=2613769 RepID=UPI000BE7B200|nr:MULTISPECIES: type I secretion system permease/ATPase [unclassified Rhizobium]PDT10839.1 ABC transporter ATP-binding protein [Rhizobium sp. M1]PDT37410.1 ABC transporter ATP-binding protein [Rhizobium sp. M10]
MATISTKPARPQTHLVVALRACAGAFGLVFLYSCGYNLFLLAPSIYLLQIYDRVLSSRSADTLLMLTLIIAIAVLVGSMLDIVRRAALSRVGSWVDHRLRPLVLTASFEYAARVDAGAATECYRDLAALRQFLDSPASSLFFDVPWAPVFLLLLFLVHPLLGAIGLLSAVALLLFAFLTELATREPLAHANLALSRSYFRFATALKNIEVIRAMGMQDGAAMIVYRDAEMARRAQDIAMHRTEIILGFSKSIRTLAQILMMGSATWLVLANDGSPGIIFVASLLLGRGLAPIEGAIGAWRSFTFARNAFNRLNRMLLTVASEHDGRIVPFPEPNGLVLDNVSYIKPFADRPILTGITLRLAPGDCIALIGPSGSGKSTLGRVMAGVVPATSGCALLGGVDISALRLCGGTRHVGYLPQDIELFGGAIKDVIGRLDGEDPGKAIDAAKLVGLHEAIMRLPQGYETDIGENGSLLLRAQRQQLGLARAAYGNPSLIVLDDPNSSLDYDGERMLFAAIERMKARRMTVVIITHRMGILPVTNKIAIMRNGTVAAFGDSEQIYETYLQPPSRTGT